ncbi:MAG TPA: helix-turn-helix transcriptional regulator [Ktedonobacterales bacterium]|jgi:transcriptional regulator with XRE-family HTH domain
MPTLRDLREEAFMTQVDLAKACGVSSASISDWENAKSAPSMKNRRKLMEALGKTPHEIMEAIRETQRKGSQRERPAA